MFHLSYLLSKVVHRASNNIRNCYQRCCILQNSNTLTEALKCSIKSITINYKSLPLEISHVSSRLYRNFLSAVS